MTTPPTAVEPEPWVRPADPDAGPCPKCGHKDGGIIVGGEARPHTCCDHPDCMTLAASSGPAKEPPPDLDVERLADALVAEIPAIHRWLTVGWKETMADEARALAAKLLVRLRSEPIAQ